MSEPMDAEDMAARLEPLAALPLQERAEAFGEVLAELQARLESADAAD